MCVCLTRARLPVHLSITVNGVEHSGEGGGAAVNGGGAAVKSGSAPVNGGGAAVNSGGAGVNGEGRGNDNAGGLRTRLGALAKRCMGPMAKRPEFAAICKELEY